MAKKPKCEDFIVAAIKNMRLQPSNIKPADAWSIVGLRQLYRVASEVYNAKEIVLAVNRLISKRSILAVSPGSTGMGPVEIRKLFPGTAQLLEADSVGWYFNENDVVVDPPEKGTRQHLKWLPFPGFYVRLDPIPERVVKELARSKPLPPKRTKKVHRTRAQIIIDSMK